MADAILRALTDDGSFRVVSAETTETVREAAKAQSLTGALREQFADLLTATILVRDAMSPDLRLQSFLMADDRKSRLIADTQPNGGARGLAQTSVRSAALSIGKQGVLQVARTLHNGSLHQGIVGVPENGTISSAFMRYMQESEQIITMIAVGCHMENGEIQRAGGYLVQILPEVQEVPLMVMTERLKEFENIVPLLKEGKASPRELLEETLYLMPHTIVSEAPVGFACPCNEERVAGTLASLPRPDIEEMLSDGKVLELTCDYCGTEYKFHPEKLRGLLSKN